MIKPLVLVLKQMLSVWGFTDTFKGGGLSSYAIFLLNLTPFLVMVVRLIAKKIYNLIWTMRKNRLRDDLNRQLDKNHELLEKANFIQKKKVQFMEDMVKDGSMTREFYQETI